jgi:hypothetical protein
MPVARGARGGDRGNPGECRGYHIRATERRRFDRLRLQCCVKPSRSVERLAGIG